MCLRARLCLVKCELKCVFDYGYSKYDCYACEYVPVAVEDIICH
jgi:hypothetical protein